jgi:hypothetical protein
MDLRVREVFDVLSRRIIVKRELCRRLHWNPRQGNDRNAKKPVVDRDFVSFVPVIGAL